ILAVNKWDLHEENRAFTRNEAPRRVSGEMSVLQYAPIDFLSALKKKGLKQLAPLVEDILEQKRQRVLTGELTRWFQDELRDQNPENVRVYYSHQISRRPPTFLAHVNKAEKMHFSLKRRLVNRFRERWGFM